MNTDMGSFDHAESGDGSPRVSFSADESGLPPPRVLICLANQSQEPRSSSRTWNAFKCAGAEVEFATEGGVISKADQRTLVRSWFRDALGASKEDIELYHEMVVDDNYLRPHAWSDPSFDLTQFDAVVLTTAYDKTVRQYLESPTLHKLLAKYFPLTKRITEVQKRMNKRKSVNSSTTAVEPDRLQAYVAEKQEHSLEHMDKPRKVVGALGKGVLVLVATKYVDDMEPNEQCPQIKEELEHSTSLDRTVSSVPKSTKRHTMASFSQRLHRSSTVSAKDLQRGRDEDLATKKNIALQEMCERSVLYNVETTTLAAWQEKTATTVSAFYGFSSMFAKRGDKKASEWVMSAVKSPAQYVCGPHNINPWAHVDPNYHYVSSRFPPDSPVFAIKMVEQVAEARKEFIKQKCDNLSRRSSELSQVDTKQSIQNVQSVQNIKA